MNQLLLLAALPGALLAQTLEGIWQGTLPRPNQNDGIRLAFKIDKNGNTYQGTFHNLANGRQFNLGAITLQGNAVKIVIPEKFARMTAASRKREMSGLSEHAPRK